MMTKPTFPPPQDQDAILQLYNDYAHNRLSRRDFVDKLSAYAVGGMTVASLLSFVSPDYVRKVQIRPDDLRIDSRYIEYTSPKGAGTMKGLLCMPKERVKPVGGVIVVHENRGLNPHIEDVARRVALAGFVALAPDALTP
jgi:carboxymethylenebutenolidase